MANKSTKSNNTFAKVVAGVGAVAAAGAAAVVLSDEKNREKLGNAAQGAVAKGREMVENVKADAEKTVSQLESDYQKLMADLEARIAEGRDSKAYETMLASAKELQKAFEKLVADPEKEGAEAVADLKAKVEELQAKFDKEVGA